MFLWHCPRGRPHWALPSTLPCGARTFLEREGARGRPACSHVYANMPRNPVQWTVGAEEPTARPPNVTRPYGKDRPRGPTPMEQSKETGRVEAFSDGVFAIAITLLVLNIQVPRDLHDTTLWAALLSQWPAFVAFLTSFATIGIMWMNHHRLFSLIRRVDHTLLLLNDLPPGSTGCWTTARTPARFARSPAGTRSGRSSTSCPAPWPWSASRRASR